jgi:2-oxoisovalerate dehydrogenase E1 component beta subunit
MVIRAPYGGGVGGGLYHSQSVEAFFSHVPGLKVIIPSTPYDAKGLLLSAITDPNPVLFFEPKKGYRAIKGEVPTESYRVPIGPARVARQGTDLTVYAYGMMAHYAEQAVEKVAREDGISCELVDLRTLLPVDRDTILSSFQKTGKALIIHEDNLTMGYGAEVAAVLADEGFEYMDAPIRRLGGPDIPAVPFSHPLQEAFMLNPERIVEGIRDLAAY